MIIKDIHKNIKKTLNLKKQNRNLSVEKPDQYNNLETINSNLKQKIDLKRNKFLKILPQNKDNIDDIIKRTNNQKINLKKIIQKHWKFIYKTLKIINKTKLIKKLEFYNKKIKKDDKPSHKSSKIIKIISYLSLIFAIIILDKIIVENLVKSWVDNFYKIYNNKNIESIETNLGKAKIKFSLANIFFLPFKFIPNQNIENAKNTIQALEISSKLWLETIEFYKKNKREIKNKKINDIYFLDIALKSKPFLVYLEEKLAKIKYSLKKTQFKKDNENYYNLKKAQEKLEQILKKVKYINSNYDELLKILGRSQKRKYLIIFQNNDEIRPTGGFIWSAGLMEIFDWKIQKFEKKDIYSYEWDVNKNYKEKIKAPSWVNLLSARLWLRDSNAFIDFEKSAKSINYFMKKWWYEIDWVIFINQKPIIELLEKIGNIEFKKYNSTITSKNFSEIISLLVEAKVSKKATLDTPKQVLFDFSEILKNKIIKEKKYFEILEVIIKNIESRDISIVSFKKNEQELLRELKLIGWFDYKEYIDFNYPFFISVGWNKTDRYIKRSYQKYINIEENKNNNFCSINTNLKIGLENTFTNQDKDRVKWLIDKFEIKQDNDLINISWAWENKSYTKILIPKNAIIKPNWYKVIDEKNYKIAEKLIKLKSWEKKYFEIFYKIENINCDKQNYKIYKQAWIYEYELLINYFNKKNTNKKQIKASWLSKDFRYNFE